MTIQRTIWLGAIVTAISAAVSVATVCVIVPIATTQQVVAEPSIAQQPAADPFAGKIDPQQSVFAAEQDRAAIAAIKQGLAIDLFSGTILESAGGTKLDESAESSAADDSTAQRIASAAMSAAAERLRATGQQRAAALVQAAARQLSDSTARRTTSDPPTKPR